jgi:hypothetical protein
MPRKGGNSGAKIHVSASGDSYDTDSRSHRRGRKGMIKIEWDKPSEENETLANTFIKDEYMVGEIKKKKD